MNRIIARHFLLGLFSDILSNKGNGERSGFWQPWETLWVLALRKSDPSKGIVTDYEEYKATVTTGDVLVFPI